jgi:quinoprotein glucose dehydrogenase
MAAVRGTGIRWTLAGVTATAVAVALVSAQSPAGEWPTYGGNLASMRYAPLDQITAENFDSLQVAWRFKTDNLGPRPEFNFQSTPLMVDGVLYTTAGSRRAGVALDAGTGEMLWMHRLDEGERGEAAPRRLSGRGLAYWSDGQEARIVYVTPGYRMIALDAATGHQVDSFGGRRHRRPEAGDGPGDGSDHRRRRPARGADHRQRRDRDRRRP